MLSPRVAIIVDGPNLYHMIKYLGLNFNFWALFQNIMRNGSLVNQSTNNKYFLGQNAQIVTKRYYYDALPLEEEANSFMKSLRTLGFELVPVKLKQYEHNGQNGFNGTNGNNGQNGNGETYKKYKSRTEYPIYIDLIRLLDGNKFDILILFSGDSDFQFLLHECKKAGKRVIVFSTYTNLAKELRNVAEIILLESLTATGLLFEPK